MIKRYQTRSKLTEDNCSVSFTAWDEKLKRPVVLKTAKAAAGDPESFHLFKKKHRLLASIHHPVSVEIYNFDESDGVFSVVTEPVDGTHLADVCAEGLIGASDFELLVEQTLSWAMAWETSAGCDVTIRPEHILVIWESGAQFRFKVSNFDMAEEPERARENTPHTPNLLRSLAGIFWFSVMGEMPAFEPGRFAYAKALLRSRRPDLPESRADWLAWLLEQAELNRILSAGEAYRTFSSERDARIADTDPDDDDTAPIPLELLEESCELVPETRAERRRKITSIPLPTGNGRKRWRLIQKPEKG